MSSESTTTSNPSEQVQQPAGGFNTQLGSKEHTDQSGKDHAQSSGPSSEDEHPIPASYPLIDALTYGSGILIAPACTSDGRSACSPYTPEEQIRRYHEAKAKEQQGEGGEET